MGPLAYMGIAQGASTLGKIIGGSGGQTPQIPIEIRKELERQWREFRTSDFIPDRKAFDARTEAALNSIYQNLGVTTEGYRANQASRGVFTGGEGAGAEYRDVIAPAVGQASLAVTEGNVQFERARLAALDAAHRLKLSYGNLAANSWRPEGGGAGWQDQLGTLLSDAGNFGTNYMILKQLGIFGEG